MKINDLTEDGVIVKGVNTTPDVQPGETERQAKKFFGGNGKPKPLGVKGATPNQAFNLGLVEAEDKKDILKGMDAKTVKAINNLMIKFPHAKDPITAIIADIEDSQEISIRNDLHNERRDKALDKKVVDLDKRLSDLENKKSTDVTEDEDELTMIQRAEMFAQQAHKDHKRKYTGDPYYVHLDEVRRIVAGAGGSEDMQAAALLHDTVEDTSVTSADIMKEFGPRIAKLVVELTDISKPEDGNRATRKAMDRDKLSGVSAEAQTIKYADLISNGKDIMQNDPKFAKVYMKEKADLLRVMKRGNSNLRSAALAMLPDELKENMSVTGTERRRLEKKKGLEIGSPEWFKHWFDLPYLREAKAPNPEEMDSPEADVHQGLKRYLNAKPMPVKVDENNGINKVDIQQLETFADKLFGKVGIDVEFTRHFMDRVNDIRNQKPITMSELTRLFKQEYKRWGKPIAQMGPDSQAVMKDLQTDINLPFVLKWDDDNQELDLIAKTVMRKSDFKTSNKEFAIEMSAKPDPKNPPKFKDDWEGYKAKKAWYRKNNFYHPILNQYGGPEPFSQDPDFNKRIDAKLGTIDPKTNKFYKDPRKVKGLYPDPQGVEQRANNIFYKAGRGLSRLLKQDPDWDPYDAKANQQNIGSLPFGSTGPDAKPPQTRRSSTYQPADVDKVQANIGAEFGLTGQQVQDYSRKDMPLPSKAPNALWIDKDELPTDAQVKAFRKKYPPVFNFNENVPTTNKPGTIGQHINWAGKNKPQQTKKVATRSTQDPQSWWQTVLQKGRNLFDSVESFTDPNFEVEWSEAVRYPEFVKIGKEAWIELAKTGEPIDVDNAMSNKINNTEAGENDRSEFDNLEEPKKERFRKAVEAGTVELPIIARYSDGYLELVAGNTRLTGMMNEFGSGKAWIFDVPDEVAVLGESEQLDLKKKFEITDELKQLDSIFKKGKHEVRIVGGAVRDLALGKNPKDIDLATDATPQEMQKMFDGAGIKHIPTGIEHGTITAVINDEPYEITTLRADVETDGRRAEVEFVRSWEEDAKRRDLTYNAMSMDFEGNLYDYHGGMDDLQDKVTKFVGDPEERIKEDYLRTLRYFRFQGRLDTPTFDRETMNAIASNTDGLKQLSVERVWMEMSKILGGGNIKQILGAMQKAGVLGAIGLNYTPNNDVMDGGDPIINLARITDEEMIGPRWKMSNEEKSKLGFLLGEKGKTHDKKWYTDMMADGFDRTQLDALARYNNQDDMIAYVKSFKAPEFPVDGNDLIKIGHERGPGIGKTLMALRNQWKQGNFSADKDELLKNITESPRDMGTSDLVTKDAVQNELDNMYNRDARGRVKQGRAEEQNDGVFQSYTIKKFEYMESGIDRILYFLVDKNDTPIFYVSLVEHEDGLAVTNVLSKGIIRATSFYYHLLQNETDELYSDTKQTTGGQKIWNDLQNSYPVTVTSTGDRLVATNKVTEEGPFGVLARKAGHLINKSQYVKAAEMLHKILKRKYDETGGKLRHTLGYYAQMIGNQTGNKINWRELEQEYINMYGNAMFENFADGKKPGRKGLSKRVGIPKGATLAQLEKIAKNSTGERRRMAQWQLNMRRGKNKSK